MTIIRRWDMLNESAYKDLNNAFIRWVRSGSPEACEWLNDSSIEFIRTFSGKCNAKGYIFHKGIVDIPSKPTTFCLNYIFDGKDIQLIERLEAETDELKRVDILEKFGAVCLSWS